MANIGTLTANLTLESAAFIRDMSRAQRAVATNTAQMRQSMRGIETATRNVERSFSQLRAGAAALAGALAVRQFSQFTRAAIDSASAIKDTADKVGLTTTQLQQLRFAAGQSGVAVSALDMGMQRFSRRIAEVAQGTGSLRETAQQYNVALLDSNGKLRSNIAILGDFADVIARAENDQERLRIAFKLFDSEGAALVNTMRDGRAGLEAYMRQASAFGAVMSSDVIDQAKVAGDNLAALESVFKTTFDTAIIKSFGGALVISGESIQSVSDVGRRFGEVVGTAMRIVVEGAEWVGRNMREIGAALAAVAAFKGASMFLGMGTAVAALATQLLAARGALAAMGVALAANPIGLVATAIAAAAAALVLYSDKTVQVGNQTVEVGRIIAGVWQTVANSANIVTTAIGYVGASLAALAEGDLDLMGEIRRVASAEMRETVAAIGDAWSDLGPRMDAAAAGSEDLDAAIAALSATMGEVSYETETADGKARDFLQTLVNQRDQAKALAAAHRQGADAIEKVEAAITIFNAEMAAGVAFTDEQRRAMFELIKETNDYNDAIDATVEAQKAAAKAAEVAQRAREKAAEDAQREMERRAEETERLLSQPFENFLSGAQSAFVNFSQDILSGGVKTFSDLFATAKQLGIRFASEMAALLVFSPQVVTGLGSIAGAPSLQNGASGGSSMLGSLFGGGGIPSPTSLFQGVTSSINGFGASLGFASSASAGTVTAASVGPGVVGPHVLGSVPGAGSAAATPGFFGSGATLSGTLGAAGIGAFAGGLIASLTGGNQLGGSIGGGLGAGIGFAVGGPIGGVIGGLGGSVIGSLFGPGKSVGPNAAARVIGNEANGFSVGGTGADNGGDLAGVVAEAQRAADALDKIRRAFDLTVAGSPADVLPGRNFIGTGTAAGRGFSSAEAFVTAFLQAGGFSGGTEALTKVLRGSTSSNLEENLNLLGQVPGLLGPATSAFDQALQAVNDNFDAITAKAEKFGLATDLVAQARERELAAVEAQARAPYLADAGTLVDFLNAQRLSDASSLSPTARLAEAQRQFRDVLARVQNGETGLASSLTGAAGNLLSIGRQNFASSEAFAGIEGYVRSSLVGVADTLASEDYFQAQVEATRQQTQVLADGQDRTVAAIEQLQREIRLLRQDAA